MLKEIKTGRSMEYWGGFFDAGLFMNIDINAVPVSDLTENLFLQSYINRK